jgi:hypothetical protein
MVLIIINVKIDRFKLIAHTDRSKFKINRRLIRNIKVIDGIIELNEEGSNDEKISGIIAKHRIILFHALKASSFVNLML